MSDHSTESQESGATTIILDYEKLVEEFEYNLVNKLRGNRPDEDYLELWVPDSDPLKGISQMVDAAYEAGRHTISIRVGASTLQMCPISGLVAEISRVGRVTTEQQNNAVVLHVYDLQAFRPERRIKSSAAASRGGEPSDSYVPSGRIGAPPLAPDKSYVAKVLTRLQASQVAGNSEVIIDLSTAMSKAAADRITSLAAEYGQTEHTGEQLTVHLDAALAPFAAAPPTFRSALAAAAHDLTHEGDATAPKGTVTLSLAEHDTTLTLAIDPATHQVIRARHANAKSLLRRAIMDVFCRSVEGLPLIEAYEHSGQRLLHALRDRRLHRPVAGIMRTVNAGPDLEFPVRLIRKIYASYREETGYAPGINFYKSRPAESWMRVDRGTKIDGIQATITDFREASDLAENDLVFRELGKNLSGYEVRVFIEFSSNIAWLTKPLLMMRLERALKDRVEPVLEVYNEEARDKSPLRRL